MKNFSVVALAVFVTGLCGNALAQDDVSTAEPVGAADPASPQITASLPTVEECLADLAECREALGAQTASSMDLLIQLAERMGFASVDDMLASDCRSRRGTWSGGQCLCASPSEWYTAETEECCVENARAYERRQDSCRDSGGSYSCRGGCRCPMGTQLLDGRCQGDATTRQEIIDLRIVRDERVPALEADIARLQAELDAARETGEDQAERISALESQLAAAQNQLEFLRELLAAEDVDVPPMPPITAPPPPIPGTDEAVAGAVDPSTENPVTDIQPPAESDETWCEANPGWCTLVVIGSGVAAAGLGLGICAAAGCFEPDEIEASWGYN